MLAQKNREFSKAVDDSPGSSIDDVSGDEILVAAVAAKTETTIAATDQSVSEQTGKVNTAVESKVNAGGNVNTDDWTSRILALSALSAPLAFLLYIFGHRLKWFRVAVDAAKGKFDQVEETKDGVRTK